MNHKKLFTTHSFYAPQIDQPVIRITILAEKMLRITIHHWTMSAFIIAK